MADDINLNINLDTDQAGKELDKFTKALDQKLKESEGRASSFGKAFSVGIAAIGTAFLAIREAVDFFAAGIEDAAQSEAAIAKLSNQLKIAGDFSQAAVDSFTEFASAIEKSTNVSEELVLEQAGIAKAFGLSNEETQKLIKAAVELSAVTGDDLSSSVQQLIKSYNGQSKALEASVGEVKTLTKEQLKAGAAIDLIAEKFDGTAAKATQTYAGSLQSVNRAIGDFGKEVGKSIVNNDKLVALFGSVTKAVDRIVDSLSQTDSISKFVDFAVDGFLLLGQTITGIGSLIERLVGFGLVAITAGIEGIILGLEKLARVAKLSDLANSLEDARVSLSAFNKSLGKNVVDGTGAFGKLFDEVSRVKKEIQATGPAAKKASDEINKAAKDTKPIIDGDELEKLREEYKKFSNDILLIVADETQKVNLKRQEQIDKLDDFKKRGVITQKEYSEEVIKIDKATKKELEAIQEKANEKTLADQKKLQDDIKASAAAAFADPIRYAVEAAGGDLTIKPDDGEFIKAAAAIGGAVNSALSGEEGAKKLAAQFGSTALDLLIPGLGTALGPLIETLTKNPEELKKNLEAFIAAFPDVLIALITNIPTILELIAKKVFTLNVFKKLAVGLSQAILDAIVNSNVALFQGLFDLLKQGVGLIAGGVVTAFQALYDSTFGKFVGSFAEAVKNVVSSIANAIKEAITSVFNGIVKTGLGQLFTKFVTDIGNLFAGIGQLFQSVIDSIGGFFTDLATNIAGIFKQFADSFQVGIAALFTNFFAGIENIGNTIKTFIVDGIIGGGVSFIQSFIDGVINVFSGIFQSFKDTFSLIGESIRQVFQPILDVLSTIFDPIINVINKIIDSISNLGGGTVSKVKSGTKKVTSALGFAEGGLVPSGFPNDTFPARLTSGELIVPTNLVSALSDFLSNPQPQTSGGDEVTQALLAKILAKIDQPINVTTTAEVNGRGLADIILQLNRNNARLTA